MLQKKRFTEIISVFIVFTFLIFNVCCKYNGKDGENFTDFSVCFFDTCEGDCAFIEFTDGKTMLIDTGDRDQKVFERIKNVILQKTNTIDYLVLTNPDNESIGNAIDFMEAFSVKRIYLSDIRDFSLFLNFKQVIDFALSKGIEIKYSCCYDYFVGEDYGVAFLSPKPFDLFDSEYRISENPTNEMINNMSAVIYMDYLGTRFLFTGDINYEIEDKIISDCKSSLYTGFYKGLNVDLNGIDFLKIGNHGARTSSSLPFLNYLLPKNAIISVGAFNNYGYPDTLVLQKLYSVNEDVNIYRTDVNGDVYIKLIKNNYMVQTERT